MLRTLALWLFAMSGTIAMSQSVSDPLIRHYAEGQKLTYKMRGMNESWQYQVQAHGIVKRDSNGTYFEDYRWSHLVSAGQAVTLSAASLHFVEQLTLDANRQPAFPKLGRIDPRLIGPVTDMFTFYSDLWLAEKLGTLRRPGDRFYFKHGTPASWADGNAVLIGQDSIDFDFTLKDIDRSSDTATLLIRHIPPKKPEIALPAEWIHQPVADTANNWVQVRKSGAGKYLAAVGKELFDVRIVVSLVDGKILSASMDNEVKAIERECSDAALSQCLDPKPHLIHRQISIRLQP